MERKSTVDHKYYYTDFVSGDKFDHILAQKKTCDAPCDHIL